MNTAQIKLQLIEVYPRSKSWKTKVEKMSDEQAYAIYRRFKATSKIK